MDDGGGEPGKLMEKRVVGILGDVVGLRHAAAVADRDAHFGVEVVADPSDSDLIHPFDPGYGGEDPRDLVDQTRVDGVHESLVDHRRRAAQHCRITAVMARPTTGSASSQPRATPPLPARTAADMRASVRAWRPSATSAAEPIARPTVAGPGAGE